MKNSQTPFLCCLVSAIALLVHVQPALAADHGDSPNVSTDQGADLADAYLFLDPNDNSKLVVIATVRGFIVPGEAVNFGIFDPKVRFQFNFETDGDAKEDKNIAVTFNERQSTSHAQTASIRFGKTKYSAPVTNPSLAAEAPGQIVTALPNGIEFFAGEVDDPFFFDIPAFNRFVASVLAGAPDASQLSRGRDTFAGYNIMAIAMRMPVSSIGPSNANVIGMNVITQRNIQMPTKTGDYKIAGTFRGVDRVGVPAVNVALVPFGRKNEYNAATGADDAKGKFGGDIVGTLRALGTNQENIDILASVAVTHGDFLRLNVQTPNIGEQGGNNAGAGFPNGRRLSDDVIDTILFFVANQNAIGDNVNGNDVAFQNSFPFLAPAQQPREPGTIDDNTRN
jgi:hypothetical protein